MSNEKHNFIAAAKDLKFCNNEEIWDDTILAQRIAAGRPSLSFNLLVPYIRNVIGEQRESRPDTLVKPGDQKATVTGAKLREGYLRNRKHVCKADMAYDKAFADQLQGGFGFFRIYSDYDKGKTFDQHLQIKALKNQFTVVFDPDAEDWHCNDGEWLAVLMEISRSTFKRKYPNIVPTEMDLKSFPFWYPKNKKNMIICEYFEKEHKKENIYQLNDGQVVDEEWFEKRFAEHGKPEDFQKVVGAEIPVPLPPNAPPGVEPPPPLKIVKKRSIDNFKIYRYLACGHAILEPKAERPTQYWEVIPVPGDELVIEGKTHKRSLIRFSKDGMRAYSYSRSTELEVMGMVPKSPLAATPAMIEEFEDQWNHAYDNLYPWLPFNPDPMMPGAMPQRINSFDPGYIAALSNSSSKARDEVFQTIGPIMLRNQGQIPADISAQALHGWQHEGDASTLIFVDNFQRSIEWGDVVALDIMGRILDTERMLTLRNADGTTSTEIINKIEQKMDGRGNVVYETLNDMTVGEYVAETTLGPSYYLQRAELADKMLKFVQTLPQIATPTAHILAAMLFDVSNAGAHGGLLEKFVDTIKKLQIMGGLMTPNELTPEEQQRIMPMIVPPKPPPPPIMAKMKDLLASAAKKMAEAQKIEAETGKISQDSQAELFKMVLQLGALAMQPAPPQEQQQQITGAGGAQPPMQQGMIEGRQGGGPVEAGHPYQVGEKGKETYIPDNRPVAPNSQGLAKELDKVRDKVKDVVGETVANTIIPKRKKPER